MTPEEESSIARLAAEALAAQTAFNALDQDTIEDVAAALRYIADFTIDPRLSPALRRCIARDLVRRWVRAALGTTTRRVLGALAAEALTTLFGGRYSWELMQAPQSGARDWCTMTSSSRIGRGEGEVVTSRQRQAGNH